MAKPKLNVDSASLQAAHNEIHKAARDAEGKTRNAIGGVARLRGKGGHAVFAALIDGVVDELKKSLPSDIEHLIESYGDGLLDLDNAARNADEKLAGAANQAGSVAVFSGIAAVAGGSVDVQGGSPRLQGGSVSVQGQDSPTPSLSTTPGSPAGRLKPVQEPFKIGTQNYSAQKSIDLARNEVGTSRATGYDQPGECVKSVQRWIDSAGGSFSGGGVVSGYESSGAVSVTMNDVKPGDVLQLTSTTDPDSWYGFVHTVLVAKVNGDGTYDIIQSNSPPGSGKVTEDLSWIPKQEAGWEWQAWRFAAQP